MAITLKLYSNAPLSLLLDKLGDLSGETTLKCALCTNAYTFDQDNHDFFDDITNELPTANGYTAGGKIMTTTNPTVTARVTTFDCADTQWANASFTARYAIIYDYTGGAAATNALIACVDFDGDKTPENGTFKIAWNASGIFSFTVSA